MQFDHPPTSEELAALCKAECNDPTSLYYKRKLERPKIPVIKALLCLFVALALSTGLGFLLHLWLDSTLVSILASLFWLLLLALVHAKRIAIFSVRVYQRLAPEKVRKRCRYEPSCSHYMIASLEKYGFFKGFAKGITRWRSCKPPNGGFDFP